MRPASFVYLGADDESRAPLHLEGQPLDPGTRVPAVWRRSPPWNPKLGFERVILGSHPSRADLHLEGDGVQLEHARMYFAREGDRIEFRPLEADTTRIDGRDIERLEVVPLGGGEQIEIGPWKFRFELES